MNGLNYVGLDPRIVEYLKRKRGLEESQAAREERLASRQGEEADRAQLIRTLLQSGAALGSVGGKTPGVVDPYAGLEQRQAAEQKSLAARQKRIGAPLESQKEMLGLQMKAEEAKQAEKLKREEMGLKYRPKYQESKYIGEGGESKVFDPTTGTYQQGFKTQEKPGGAGSAKAQANIKETTYRYNILQRNADELKKMIKRTGTFELTGPESSRMKNIIYQMAVDFAKMVDPTSVAREGEVKAAQEYMLPIQNYMGLAYSNQTAEQLIDDYKKDLDERLRAKGLDPNEFKSKMAPQDQQAIQWLEKNPTDPTAPLVRKKLQEKGFL